MFPPHLDTTEKHVKLPFYEGSRQITPPKKLHEKGQFPTLYSVFWLVAPPSHGMRGQEFCPSSFSKLSLHFVLPPVLPPPIFRQFHPPGTGTRTFPDPSPSNALRTPFKRGRDIKPTDALNAHIQRIYPHTNKKGHTRKRAALYS